MSVGTINNKVLYKVPPARGLLLMEGFMCTSQLYRVEDLFTHKVEIGSGAWLERLKGSSTKPRKITPIPCGKCIECRIKKAQEWAFRCMKEAAEYDNNVMVTLTYNDENLPNRVYIDRQTGESETVHTLVKKDVQDFIKRLRKHYKGQTIRYYMCGEYGSDKEYYTWKGEKREATKRPHYHIIFFNLDFEDKKEYKYSKCEWSKDKNILYKSKVLDKLWKKGHADINEVNYETCCYVARYVTKKMYGAAAEEHYKGRLPEYTCMSRRPGIGYSFFEKNREKFENEEDFWQKTKKGLKLLNKIRYFDKQIEKENPEKLEEIKKNRERKSKDTWNEILKGTDISKEEYIRNRIYRNEQKFKTLNIRELH